jgi:hypothetical protein
MSHAHFIRMVSVITALLLAHPGFAVLIQPAATLPAGRPVLDRPQTPLAKSLLDRRSGSRTTVRTVRQLAKEYFHFSA